jgi:hypothetical protein
MPVPIPRTAPEATCGFAPRNPPEPRSRFSTFKTPPTTTPCYHPLQ